MPVLPLSLVVITHNEAANIARCLDSVPFAAEKLIIDSGSTDTTVAIAQARGARVVHQDWLGFGPQRNFASTQARHDWILVLDADEFLDVRILSDEAVFTACRDGALTDAKTQTCLLWLQNVRSGRWPLDWRPNPDQDSV